jgi:AraC-like DNA-binding protein
MGALRMTDSNLGTFGFRFAEPEHLSLCSMYAVGHESVADTSYRWDGLTRSDGPLLLFQYTIEGEGRFEIDGQAQTIGPGRAFLAEIPGNHRYYYPDSAKPWEFYFLLFRPRLIQPNWEEMKAKISCTPFLPITSSPIRLLRNIFIEGKAGRITDPYLASSYVFQFVSELCRFSLNNLQNQERWPEKIRMATQFMDANYAHMISLEQLAHELALSKYYFIRLFSASVGMTPNDYLNRIRTEKAMKLLRETDWNLERVASEVGYSSGSYLIKVFRRLTGQTPGGFRTGTETLLYNRLFFN